MASPISARGLVEKLAGGFGIGVGAGGVEFRSAINHRCAVIGTGNREFAEE